MSSINITFFILQVGHAALAALSLAVLLTPITKYVMKQLTKMRKDKVKLTDERVKVNGVYYSIMNGCFIRIISSSISYY